MTPQIAHRILMPFFSSPCFTEWKLLHQCESPEQINELLAEGYIRLISDCEDDKRYSLTERGHALWRMKF